MRWPSDWQTSVIATPSSSIRWLSVLQSKELGQLPLKAGCELLVHYQGNRYVRTTQNTCDRVPERAPGQAVPLRAPPLQYVCRDTVLYRPPRLAWNGLDVLTARPLRHGSKIESAELPARSWLMQ
nr:hypothetical protein 68B2.220 [imported] - Neurospora crassa [Neurospora crassa]